MEVDTSEVVRVTLLLQSPTGTFDNSGPHGWQLAQVATWHDLDEEQ